MSCRILIVDSDAAFRARAVKALAGAGHPLGHSATATDALKILRGHPCSVVVCDGRLDDRDGFDLMREILREWPATQLIVTSADPGPEAARQAIRIGAVDYLAKPVDDANMLIDAVQEALTRASALSRKDAVIRKLTSENEELERVNYVFRRLATRDGLTTLHNRLYFNESLTSEIERARRKGHELVLIFIDVDHFKLYNDTFGHQHGDLLLKQLGKLIRSSIRDSDVAARWGGEEFAVLASETTLTGGVGLAEKLRACLEAFPFHGAEAMPGGCVTASAGVAALHAEDNERELVHRADRALYQAKATGRNRVVADEAGCGEDTRKMLASLGGF